MRASHLWVLLIGLACSDEEGTRWERSEFTDEGSLCLRAGAAGELSIDVVVDGCASGCARVVESTCEVDPGDAEFVVHSSVTVEERRGPDVVCPAACVPVGAGCGVVQVSPGDYLFHYGGNTSAASLPTEAPLLLGGRGAAPDLWCR